MVRLLEIFVKTVMRIGFSGAVMLNVSMTAATAQTPHNEVEASTQHYIPYFLPSTGSWGFESFVRIVWHTCRIHPEFTIHAMDDEGEDYGPINIPWQSGPGGCGKIVYFNSRDLERGNANRGILPGIGTGKGAWQLFITSTDPVYAVSYIKRRDAGHWFSPMHGVVPFSRERNAYFIPMFNRGRWSFLRIINPNDHAIGVTILGQDDHMVGTYDSGPFLSLEAHQSVTISAYDMEQGREEWKYPEFGHDDGALSNSPVGRWRLYVQERSGPNPNQQPLIVVHLLRAQGQIINLSTVPHAMAAPMPFSPSTEHEDILSALRRIESYLND